MWEIKDILAIGEIVIYQCQFESKDGDYKFCLTNHRIIILGEDYYVYSIMTKAITSVMMVDGYEEWADVNNDIGDGEYAVRCYSDEWETIWFQSRKVRKEAYDEIMRAIIDEE